MTLEQELVRLYGGVARKSAGYQIPFSACTVISSQMRAPGIKVLFMHCLLSFIQKLWECKRRIIDSLAYCICSGKRVG